MTALEKINSIAKREHVRSAAGELRLLDISLDDLRFILKAFKVMREMAINNASAWGSVVSFETGKRISNEDAIDSFFERRMAEK